MRTLLGLREPGSFRKRPEFAIEVSAIIAEQPGVPAGQEGRQKFFLLGCQRMLAGLRTFAAVQGDVPIGEVPGREIAALRGPQPVVGAKENHHAELEQNRPGLPKLLDSNVDERWMVTEFFPNGTLEDHLLEYKGNPALALEDFRSVVQTTSRLHKERIVHRDFKPANIFVRGNHELVLGDFGLVYVPDKAPRLTAYEGETVGAGDFIPPWGDIGIRLENVNPNFDVYMLGKVLWCMVAGKPVLKREYFDREANDVTLLFPNDPHSYMINELLKHSVVENQKACFSSADDLLLAVDTYLEIIKRGGQLLKDGIPRPCHVCGHGHYVRQVHDKDDPVYQLRIWTSGGTHPDTTFFLKSLSVIRAVTFNSSARPLVKSYAAIWINDNKKLEWRELIDELDGSLKQMSYTFHPANVAAAGDDRNNPTAGIQRGSRVMTDRIFIASTLKKYGVLRKWEDV